MSLAETFARWEPALLVVVFLGLALLAAGYFYRGRERHRLRAAGWVVFAAYWPFQSPGFFAIGDPVNAYFTLFAPFFLGFLAYHEWRSFEWNEDPPALKWIAGATVVAAATYFIIYKIPWVTSGLIYVTALQSAWMLGWLFNLPAVVTRDAAGESHIFINGSEYAVTIVLACTAIQSMMIFVGAIACTRAARRRQWLAYAWTVPTIYFLNLFRNAGIVYGYKILEWNPFGWGPTDSGSMFWQYQPTYDYGSFEWMHSYVGKIGSLLAMVVIALAVFRTLPELHSNVLDVFDLWKRRKPGFFAPEGGPAKAAPVARAGAAPAPASVGAREAHEGGK